MSEQLGNTRQTFIPFGNCLPGSPAAEAFHRIEQGQLAAEDIKTAGDACFNCPQLAHCQDEEQQKAIGAEILRQQGTTIAIVGAEIVESSPTGKIKDPLQPPNLIFDISQVPENPQQQLALLRQAVRTKQFATTNVKYAAIDGIAQTLLDRTPDDKRQEWQKILHEASLFQALRDIIAIKFQQLDATKIKHTPGRARSEYDPATFDLDKHTELINTFINEVVKLKELKLRGSPGKAILYDSNFYQALAERYFNGVCTAPKFKEILSRHPLDPETALEEEKQFESLLETPEKGLLSRTQQDETWIGEALCREYNSDMFYPEGTSEEKREIIQQAKSVCNQCPVIKECLKTALDYRETYGIWGGTTPDERKAMLRKRRRR